MTAGELYVRGAETLVASWEAYARGSSGATVLRMPGAAVAVLPSGPERGVYNNALLERGLGAVARRETLDAVARSYAARGVSRYAAWVHESDEAMRCALEARGYTFDTSTRAMGMSLTDLRVPRPELELAPPDWSAYLEYLAGDGLPKGLLAASSRRRSTWSSPAAPARASRPASRSTATATAASTTSGRASMPVAAAREPPSPRCSPMTRERAGAARRASSRARWRSACTPASASGTSAGSSSSCRRPRVTDGASAGR